MTSASQTAGMVGKFGQSSFTSISGVVGASKEAGRMGGPMPPRPPKFFKSRKVEESIEESQEDADSTLSSSNFATPKKTPTDSIDSNLVVAVRVRPMQSTEQENIVDIDGSQVVVAAEKVFNFDEMFGPNVAQEELYERLVYSSVEKVLEGFNSTILAYGQTGTGKTFTMGTNVKGMEGEVDEHRGIVTRVLQHIFSSNKVDFLTVKISFYEINKEQVYDLINPSSSKVPLQVKEVQPVFKVVQLTEVEVTEVSKAIELLCKGSSIRSTESTSMNSSSSRSHAIFTISLVSRDMADGSTVTRKINLVDLAGSENPNRTQAVGNRFTEGVGINMGLSTLSRVITALSKKSPYVPYRDSTLTKVLKECLQSHCYITMVSCISPNLLDMQETISTLRFSNSAKHLRTKPLPANLLSSCRTSVAKKRTHALGIPATPHQGNNTIHTVTPSKSVKSGFKRTLNSTIGTPGKRAKGETNRNNFNATPMMSNRPVTSTTSKYHRPEDDLCDISGVSMIEPPEDQSDNATTSIPTSLTNSMPAEVTQFFSPLMRAVKETVKENMKEEFSKMFKELKADLTSSKITSKTPIKMAKSRATSSPNRLLARTRNSPLDMSEDSDLANTTIVVNDMASTTGEDIISGAGVTLPVKEKPNPILRAVINSASPELSRTAHPLPVYQSPPSTQVRPSTSSPTIEEMERTLGINPDSPGAIMFTAPTSTVNTTNKPKRSTRRTTMMSSELNQTLKEIQNTNHGRRRSVRVAAQGRYYGSPGKEDENNRHLLMEQDNWKKVDPRKQALHNNRILDFLNTGNAKVLAGLPAVGPKTAFLIHQHRDLHGYFNNLKELENIPGISKIFFAKFCRQNQIIVDE